MHACILFFLEFESNYKANILREKNKKNTLQKIHKISNISKELICIKFTKFTFCLYNIYV